MSEEAAKTLKHHEVHGEWQEVRRVLASDQRIREVFLLFEAED